MKLSRLDPGEVRKFAVAGVAAIGELLALGLLNGTPQKVALIVLAVAGAFGVYAVPNRPQP